ncbi:MAG: DNA mismatch repair protein MutS [Oscillospiraceae bacterium]|nr:DNA mismatch repair protein MutS [Oscillospiraceae bacterium]
MIDLTFAQKENIGFQYVLDALRPSSPYGEERVRELRAFERSEKDELLRQLGNVQRMLDGEDTCKTALNKMLRVFMTVKHLRATVKKCAEASLDEIELFTLKVFLLKSAEILPLWQEVQSVLQLDGVSFEDTTAALDLLDPEGNRVASFFISDNHSPLLRSLRKEKRALEEEIRRLAPGEEKEEKQAKRARVAAEEELEEMRIRKELSFALRPYLDAMAHNMDAIGEIDFTVEKARVARRYGGVMPVFTESSLEMTDMVNPKLSDLLKDRKKSFTPVSLALEKGATVITGANMGGKSVAMKTVALNVLLAHCGFFPFAKAASLPLFDSMYIVSEDLESVDRGLSSFGGEIVRFNEVLRRLEGEFAFVLLDEFARGTNPDEGAAIVQSVTQYLQQQNAISVFATHYDGVVQYAGAHYQVIGLKELDVDALKREMAGLTGDVGVTLIGRHMNYGLYRVEGKADCPRDALNICRLLGMKNEIVDLIKRKIDT